VNRKLGQMAALIVQDGPIRLLPFVNSRCANCGNCGNCLIRCSVPDRRDLSSGLQLIRTVTSGQPVAYVAALRRIRELDNPDGLGNDSALSRFPLSVFATVFVVIGADDYIATSCVL